MPSPLTEHEAIACAARVARKYWLTAAAFRDAVTQAQPVADGYQRALHLVERREVVLHCEPAFGTRPGDTQPLPDPNTMDPWEVDEEELRQRVATISECPACNATRRSSCNVCHGEGRVACPECTGRGWVPSVRGTKKCPTCRARGDSRCSNCTGGKVDCRLCGLTGRVLARLVLVRREWHQVCVAQVGAAVAFHTRVLDPADFDVRPESWPNELVQDTGLIRSLASLPADLCPSLHPRLDRPVAVRVQTFRRTRYQVEYRTFASAGVVGVERRGGALHAESDWRALALRRRLIESIAVLGAVIPLAVLAQYWGRHAWYGAYGHGSLVFAGTLIAVAASVTAIAAMLLRPSPRWRLRVGAPAGVALAALLATSVVYARGPNAATALQALANHDHARATTEAAALRELNVDPAAGESVLDAVHLGRLEAAAPDIDVMVSEARGNWYQPASRATALQRVHAFAAATVASAAQAHDAAAIEHVVRAIDGLDPAGQDEFARQAWHLRLDECLSSADASCVNPLLLLAARLSLPDARLAELKAHGATLLVPEIRQQVSLAGGSHDLATKRAALDNARQLAGLFTQWSGHASEPSVEDLARQLNDVDQRIAQERRRDDVRAAHEQARQQRENDRRARADERANRGLRCCDGTISPSCMCAGSHGGCCSRHGGVCGCE